MTSLFVLTLLFSRIVKYFIWSQFLSFCSLFWQMDDGWLYLLLGLTVNFFFSSLQKSFVSHLGTFQKVLTVLSLYQTNKRPVDWASTNSNFYDMIVPAPEVQNCERVVANFLRKTEGKLNHHVAAEHVVSISAAKSEWKNCQSDSPSNHSLQKHKKCRVATFH